MSSAGDPSDDLRPAPALSFPAAVRPRSATLATASDGRVLFHEMAIIRHPFLGADLHASLWGLDFAYDPYIPIPDT